jgi:hypothetical protein
MNFEKAYKELLAGKKIRRKEWEVFMHLRIIDGHVKTFKGEYTNFYANADIILSEGWKVVDGDGKELNYVQMVEELKNKKYITHKDWQENQQEKFIFVDKDQIAMCSAVMFDFMPSYKCLCSSDWETMKLW